jgi:hypothetical protein
VVRSPQRIVVLTTIDVQTACAPTPLLKSAGVTIKLCPTRLVVFEGAMSRKTELPASCYLEADAAMPPDTVQDASFAAYDTLTKTIKIGLIVDHKVIDECARFVPTTSGEAN